MIGGDERQRAAISFPAHRDSLHRRQRRHYKLGYSIAFVLLYTTIEMFLPVAFARQQNKKRKKNDRRPLLLLLVFVSILGWTTLRN